MLFDTGCMMSPSQIQNFNAVQHHLMAGLFITVILLGGALFPFLLICPSNSRPQGLCHVPEVAASAANSTGSVSPITKRSILFGQNSRRDQVKISGATGMPVAPEL
jgi:hypothetical protein